MGYNPVTPFRRMIDAALLERSVTAETPTPSGVNKWEALRELSVARLAYGLSDRDMTVLQALISFFPETMLEGEDLIVHPSNETICARLNGMPCSTMRRHLANLVQAGVITRRDSPNGKRYARKSREGRVVFGFDLAPLARQFAAFCDHAEAVRAARDRHKRLRETVSLMRRDLAGLAAYGLEARPDLALWPGLIDEAARIARLLRRKLELDDLQTLETELSEALRLARNLLEGRPANAAKTGNMSSSDAEIEQHHQNSNKNLHVLELRVETAKAALSGDDLTEPSDEDAESPPDLGNEKLPRMPLPLVLGVCREIETYADGPIRHWHELVQAADRVRPMMGISPSAWDEARHYMGPEEAAVTVAAMLERFTEIRSPGGYLRALCAKAADGSFSTGPMIMALMRRNAA
ncbi:MAG: replication initiation protein RepC [Rhodobacteraceae bacterium]|nr:replication initiation protein RepC [Paracoccaceae bacterium]